MTRTKDRNAPTRLLHKNRPQHRPRPPALADNKLATYFSTTRPKRTSGGEAEEETMRNHLALVLVGLAISFAWPTYSQEKDVADPRIRFATGCNPPSDCCHEPLRLSGKTCGSTL